MKSPAIKSLGIFALFVGLTVSTAAAQEVGFIEEFALAENREEVLKTLIPGSREYYYFHCLHYLNTQQFDQADALHVEWVKRYRSSAQITEMQTRLALLTYDRNPQKSLEFIRSRLNLNFNHQRDILGADPRLPTALNNELIGREAFVKRATANRGDLGGFEDRALEWMSQRKLTAAQRRNLLQRMQRPDVDGLVETIAGDLQSPGSGGFGSLPIHGRLLRSQLDSLLRLMPELRNNGRFVNAYLTRLQPADADGWQYDDTQKKAYLEQLSSFVESLSSVHNSLKAHVLYHRLDFDRVKGVYDKDRFMTYLKLPRGVRYVNPKYLQRPEHQRVAANLSQNFQSVTLMRPVGDDEQLVRSYLHHYFVDEASFTAYLPYLNDTYVKEHFAEAKLVNGLGDAERWFSLLPPGKFHALRDRVDLDFALTNKNEFAADEKVQLDVYVKNVENLIVKVFEINTQNYYRSRGREVGVDIELDGLVANHETPHAYSEPPVRRVKRRFELPMIDKRGVYVVDFIGNGTNSRALIRKGRLRKLVSTSAAGHQFTVLDGSNNRVKKASLWMAGRTYSAEKDGQINVPFSTKPGRQTIVLSDGDFHWLDSFNHQSESYQLQAGIHIDRESLLAGRKAKIVVRPSLRINGNAALLGHLEDVVMQIASTNRDGTNTTKEVKDFELKELEESTYEIQVPARLRSISVTLRARVQSVSQNKKINLSASRKFDLNGIDATDRVDDIHLAKLGGQYYLELVGKTGEQKSKRPVTVQVKHRDFKQSWTVSLQTNEDGRIALGPLGEIARISATPTGGHAKSWAMPRDDYTYRNMVYSTVGEEIVVPYMGDSNEARREEISLLETRGGAFAKDHFAAVAVDNGLLKIRGLPTGRYQLMLKDSGARVAINVVPGSVQDGFVLAQHRIAERRGRDAVQIRDIEFDEETITISLNNANSESRVHVLATRYLPEYDAFQSFAAVRDLEEGSWFEGPRLSLYAAGRQLGDENRYIIDRQYATKYPGNLLEQPGLLLHPWALRKTDAESEVVERPGAFAPSADAPSSESRQASGGKRKSAGNVAYANLDYLGVSSPILLNAKPDQKGRIRIKADSLRGRQYLTVVAVDDTATARRSVALPKWESNFADLRLLTGLNPESHFVQQKQTSVVKPGDKLAIDDFASSRFESYSGLNAVYALLTTLNPDANFRTFGFIRQWATFDEQRKRELYSEYACHELNFFLFKKDPQFFRDVIRGHLANKHHKTFMDHWLLGHDLSHFERPWAYARLNTVERVLLVQGNANARKKGARRAADLYDILPPATARLAELYKSAIMANAMDADDDGLAFSFRHGFGGESANGKPGQRGGGSMGGRGIAAGESLGRANKKFSEDKSGNESLGIMANELLEVEEKAKDSRFRRSLSSLKSELREQQSNRGRSRRLYVKLDKTQEWAENNYYHLPIERQNSDLIKINKFWRDYAAADPAEPFLSTSFTQAAGSFSEMMFALSVLDLPLENAEVKTDVEDRTAVLSSKAPIIVFHQEFKSVEPHDENTTILVSQNFFRKGDQYRMVEGQRVDKFVAAEFLIHTVYGCQIVVTNPTSTPQKLDLLLQTPVGSLPVSGGQRTQSVPMELKPYHAETLVYYFYFPAAGDFDHYPVHVSKNAELLAFTKPLRMNVVNEPTKVDRTSWAYISQYGSNDDVLKYLNNNNHIEPVSTALRFA